MNYCISSAWSFGITGKLWMWIKAYLSDRLQCVSINNIHSDVMPVISGVPQGSILGPLLFLIFVNGLPASVMSSTVLLFADDAKCIKQISTYSDCVSLQDQVLANGVKLGISYSMKESAVLFNLIPSRLLSSTITI